MNRRWSDDVTAIAAQVDAAVATAELNAEKRMLTRVHPDWQQIREGQDWKSWLDALAPEPRAEVLASNDAVFLSEALTEFKRWVKDGKKASTAAPAPKDDKQKRLEHAQIPERTGGGAAGRTGCVHVQSPCPAPPPPAPPAGLLD